MEDKDKKIFQNIKINFTKEKTGKEKVCPIG